MARRLLAGDRRSALQTRESSGYSTPYAKGKALDREYQEILGEANKKGKLIKSLGLNRNPGK